ncbi:MAG TPA: hypothetical protein VKA21_09500 [Candidatus Binatia bacterium]|nr:hypothetical protein [Candidatus Binatia bacterium]
MKSAVVLDIDNTLTPPRRPLESEMARALGGLTVPFFIGAGSDLRLAREQLVEPLHGFGFRGAFDAFLCNGSTRYRCDLGERLAVTLIRQFDFRDHLGNERFAAVLDAVHAMLDADEFRLPDGMRVIGDRIVDRVSMVNVAPIGRPREQLTEEMHASRRAFREWDERTGFRRRFLSELRRRLGGIVPNGLHVSLGGETSFDVVVKGRDKSYPVSTLLEEGFERVWYVGDALFEGGNDEAVLRFVEEWPRGRPCPVEAIAVESWRETIPALRALGILAEAGS